MINIDLFASRAMDSVSISGPLFILKLYDQFELATNHSSKCIPYIFMVYSYKEVYSFTGNDQRLSGPRAHMIWLQKNQFYWKLMVIC